MSSAPKLRPTGPRDHDRPPVDGFVEPSFREVAVGFTRLFRRPGCGGAALAVYHRGELVVDLWGGYRDPWDARPWEHDTMAMSFSTTKGVAATVVHMLASRGLVDYETPVASYWPEFAGDGRETISVRQLLSHQAGLHRIRGLVGDPEEMLDGAHMRALVASQPPSPAPGRAVGYHGLTFGWLVDGLVRAITGRGIDELLAQEIAAPLGLDGLHIGAPMNVRDRVARLFPENLVHIRVGSRLARRIPQLRGLSEALLVDGFEPLWFDPWQRILDTVMPAVNGVFTARSLARLYVALADSGAIGDHRLLDPEVLKEAGRVQRRGRDYVLGIPMRWRLGYHQAFTAGPPARRALGHYGLGGSGAWADPDTGLALGFVTNRLGSVTTPIADARLARLGAAALKAARERERQLAAR